MAIGTPTLKTSGGNSTDATAWTTASVTFVTGRVYLLALDYSRGSSADPAAPTSVVTNAGATVTWTKIVDNKYKTSGSANRLANAIYAGVCSGVGGAATTTITFGYTALGLEWHLVEYTGVDTTTPWVVGNVVTVIAAPIPTGSATVTLAALTDAGSRPFVAFGGNSNTSLYTIDADWTQLGSHGMHGSPEEFLAVAYSTAELAFTTVNGYSGANALGMIAIELRPGPPVSSTVGRAASTDTAKPIARGKTSTVGRAAGVDTPPPVAGAKASTTGPASEADTARPVASGKATTAGLANGSDTARPVSSAKATGTALAASQEAAQPVTGAKASGALHATETAAVQPVMSGKGSTVGRADSTDTAQPVIAGKATVVGFATEHAQALPLDLPAPPILTVVGLITSQDTAQPAQAGKTPAAVGHSTETAAARSISIVKHTSVGLALEYSALGGVSATKAPPAVGRAHETSTARPLVLGKPSTVGLTTETSTVRPVTSAKTSGVAHATEHDTALPVNYLIGELVAPDGRTFAVPAELRLVRVGAESRRLAVPADPRQHAVATEQRTYAVPPEEREETA